MKKALLLTALVSVSNFAYAQGFYLGAGLGTTSFEDGGLVSDTNDEYSGQVNLSTDSDSTSVKLIAGYQFNRIVGIEAQYTNYGDTKVRESGSKVANLEHNSFSIAANVGYTFVNGLRPFGTIGLGSIDYKETGSGGWELDQSTPMLRLGLGIEYAPASFNGFAIRTGYEADFYKMGVEFDENKDYDQSIGSFYIGSTYKF